MSYIQKYILLTSSNVLEGEQVQGGQQVDLLQETLIKWKFEYEFAHLWHSPQPSWVPLDPLPQHLWVLRELPRRVKAALLEGGHTLRLNTERGRTCFAASDLTLAERQDFWELTPSAGGSSPKLTLRALSSAKAPIVLVIDLDHLLVLFLIAISSTSSSWSQLIVVAWFLETHTVRIWLVSTKDVKTEIKSYSKTVQILLTGRGNRQTSSPATLSKLFLTLGLLLLVVLVLPNFQRDDVQWNQGFWLEL